VTDVVEGGGNQAPIITSGGGGASASYSRSEQASVIGTVTAVDPDGQIPVFSIVGGDDAAKFILSSTGALAFATTPDFENPTDVGSNNVYELIVRAADGLGGVDTQAIAVTVTNVAGVMLEGNKMNNALTGSAEEDTIAGLGGNDTLSGGAGNDTLLGGAGKDQLIGGTGTDRLQGDAGADLFVFNFVDESRVGGQADLIVDFGAGNDDIDLRGIDASTSAAGNQAFTFIGAAGFTGIAGQLRFSLDPAQAVTHVYGDVSGDGQADFEIALSGQMTLAASDFLL
jgi:Ca2+-binding RTX toxin-like protein